MKVIYGPYPVMKQSRDIRWIDRKFPEERRVGFITSRFMEEEEERWRVNVESNGR